MKPIYHIMVQNQSEFKNNADNRPIFLSDIFLYIFQKILELRPCEISKIHEPLAKYQILPYSCHVSCGTNRCLD